MPQVSAEELVRVETEVYTARVVESSRIRHPICRRSTPTFTIQYLSQDTHACVNTILYTTHCTGSTQTM